VLRFAIVVTFLMRLGPAMAADADAGETAAGAPSADQARWAVVWFDGFDGDALDPARWKAEASCWGGGNNERQCYTARPENVRVDGGVLRLTARPETFSGPRYPAHYDQFDGERGEDQHRNYTSGKVVTHGLGAWTYGRVSARMKLPAGKGAWPAFWMLPVEDAYGDWPLSGEIDVMEAVNLETPCADCAGGVDRRVSGALHFGSAPPDNEYLFARTGNAIALDPTREWHVYTVEWAEGVIQWFVDGRMFMRLEAGDWHTGAVAADKNPLAPFDRAFYLNINLAVGGDMPERAVGGGFDPSAFPAELLVDWVRVEQCAGDLETGLACLSPRTWRGAPMGPEDGTVNGKRRDGAELN